MKKNIIILIKSFFSLVIIEAMIFIFMIFFSVTDESSHQTSDFLYKFFNNICGFPIILLNKNFPFFLNSSSFPNYGLILILINILLQSLIITILYKFILKFKKTIPKRSQQ